MSQILDAARKNLVIYRLAIIYCVLFSVNSLTTAIVASLLNTNWRDLDQTSKFLLVIVVIQNWTGVLLAFFNKTMSRIGSGQPPLTTGDTAFLTQSTIQTTSKP